jgi:uncharacterized membrane protein
MSTTYIPGTCNLGKTEVRRRQIVALIGLVFSISSGAGLIAANANFTGKLSLFLPLMIFSVGFIQSRKKFCLAYGFMGTFNLGKLGDISRVQDPADRAADRKTALNILLQAALLAALLTAIFAVLPL